MKLPIKSMLKIELGQMVWNEQNQFQITINKKQGMLTVKIAQIIM